MAYKLKKTTNRRVETTITFELTQEEVEAIVVTEMRNRHAEIAVFKDVKCDIGSGSGWDCYFSCTVTATAIEESES